MMSETLSANRGIAQVVLGAALALVLAAGPGSARADERKFVVLLAKPTKSMPNPNAVMPNPNDVYDQYFDFVKPGVDSFAEYWHEISYGNVHVSGNAVGWVEIPWPILPAGMNPTSCSGLAIPQDVEESFDESLQMYRIDGEWVEGLVDEWWTPGERFRDLNGNKRYDSSVSTDEWSGQEPFEDFLRVYVYPSGWVKLDPSANNPDDTNRQWAEAYIRSNYPGDADALIARCGNGMYDGPDRWTEAGNGKMQYSGCLCMINYRTPPPDWDYELWWDAYWKDKHIAAGIDPPPTPPAPEWNLGIPDMQPFDVSVERPFRHNVGDQPDKAYDGISPNGPIYPDATGYYDGPAEFDDLPSSRYHARSISGLDYGGDGRLGEVTSPRNNAIYGQDFGTGDPSSPAGPDGFIPAGGPLAYNVHGTNGYDAGNVLNLEFLTTTTQIGEYVRGLAEIDPTIDPTPFRRDVNLDGLVDQGDSRGAGTENYVCDTLTFGPNDGGPSEQYPHNRQRLMEDAVAALDSTVDWDELVTEIDGVKYLFCTVLLPEGVYPDGMAAGGRGLFQLPAPAMDLPIQVRDIPADEDMILFSDFATALGTTGDSGLSSTAGFQKELMSHEFLHVWEGYPDLYDYDVYINGFENFPVGVWDIMSGDWVHPCPVLKQFGTGRFAPTHEPWLQANDLTTILRPLVETPITLTDYAFDPTDSAYYYENVTDPGERFYFWRPTRVQPANQINFNKTLPGDGVMIMHTDLGNNPENLPLQARIQTHFTYNIIQADGLQQLDNGENNGDAGDPFPGTAGTTVWNHDTDPNSRWWSQGRSGISITNIREYADRSVVTFLWEPRLVPELKFLRPPGGVIKNNSYELFYEAFDFHGGTTIELYFDRDRRDFDGTMIGQPFRKSQPQTVRATAPVPLSGLPGDGQYYFYARLVPGQGPDGFWEPSYSVLQASRNNKGRGEINDIVVDLDHSKLEAWTLMCIDDEVPGSEVWKVEGTVSGVQPSATTGVPYASTEGGVSFRIDWTGTTGGGPQVNVSNADGMFRLTDPSANFQPSRFRPYDMVRILTGPQPGSYPISLVASPTELVLAEDPGDSGRAGGVSYRVHSFRDGDDNDQPDIFTFLTTGKTPYSLPVKLVHAQIVPQVYAVLDVTFVEDYINPLRRAPVRIKFDASRSRDELGQPNPALTYLWNFGDGTTSPQPIVEHVYSYAYPAGVTVTLTVTNPASGLTGTETVQFVVRPMDDGLAIVAEPDPVFVPESGTAPLNVKLSKAPVSNVTVKVARYSGDTNISVTAGSSLTFRPDNWDVWQVVTLAAAEDGDYQPGQAVIRCTAVGLVHKTITAIEEDNDELKIVTSKNTVTIAEGGTATFQVKLAAQPLADLAVSVQRAAGDTDIAVQSGNTLDFTPANWNTWQTVTLAAAEDDDIAHGQATIRCSSPGLPDADVIVTEQDNDKLEILVGNDTVTVPEGGTAPLNVRLGAEPPADAVVTVARISGDADITVSAGAQLTFTKANWKTWQAATLAAAEDPDALNGQAVIRCSTPGMENRDVTAIERENDRFEIVTDVDAVSVLEGKSASFKLRLGARPTAKVVVSVDRAAGDTSIMVQLVKQFSFFPDRSPFWNDWQTVTLTAAEDPDLINGQATIRCSGPGLPNHDVIVTEQDNDRGLILSNRTAVRVGEGAKAEFLVKLAQSLPGDVTLSVARISGDADLTVSEGETLTFTPANWDSYQKVVLAAAEDADQENGRAVFRLSGPGLWDLDVTADEEDNDSTPIVTNVSTVEVPEGGMATFRVKLGTIPAGNVTVAVSMGDGDGDITVVSGASLTFTPANWSAWQTVTLAAAEDDDAANGTATIHCRPSSGPDRLVTAVERDNDLLTMLADTDFLFVPEGGTAVFRLRLTARPLGDLTVTVFAADGDADITVVAGSVLTFTPANWAGWQTVTLAAAEDPDATGGQATIRCVATGLPNQDLQVAEQENDAQNQAPVAQDQAVTVAHNTATVIQLTAADADAWPAPCSYVIVSPPSHGTLSNLNAATGQVTYAPANAYSGPDSFTFKANDGQLDSNIATVSLTVQADQGGGTPNPSDADGDTVPDAQDVCPGTPAGAAVDASGCAASQLDEDQDGVSDADDTCPGTAAGASVDANGCSAAQNGQPPDDSGQTAPTDNTRPALFSFCGLGVAQTLALGLSGLLLLHFQHRRRRE